MSSPVEKEMAELRVQDNEVQEMIQESINAGVNQNEEIRVLTQKYIYKSQMIRFSQKRLNINKNYLLRSKTPFISQRRKRHELIIAKKKREIPQIQISLNCQHHWKETQVCDWNYLKAYGNLNLLRNISHIKIDLNNPCVVVHPG
jgi:hypothetical protein